MTILIYSEQNPPSWVLSIASLLVGEPIHWMPISLGWPTHIRCIFCTLSCKSNPSAYKLRKILNGFKKKNHLARFHPQITDDTVMHIMLGYEHFWRTARHCKDGSTSAREEKISD